MFMQHCGNLVAVTELLIVGTGHITFNMDTYDFCFVY